MLAYTMQRLNIFHKTHRHYKANFVMPWLVKILCHKNVQATCVKSTWLICAKAKKYRVMIKRTDHWVSISYTWDKIRQTIISRYLSNMHCLKCVYRLWGFKILLSLDSPEKNCNICCLTKMSSSWTFSLLSLTEVLP